MRYAIEETTLTALGDAVRKQVGETREEMIPVEDNYYKFEIDTANPDDWAKFTGDTGYYWGYDVFYYAFRNAYAYKIIYNYVITDVDNPVYQDSASAYVIVCDHETGSTPGIIDLLFKHDDSPGNGEFIINHKENYPDLKIHCERPNNDNAPHLNLSLEIYALDENGNVINEEAITVKNTMTPMEMAEKINGLSGIPEEAFNLTGVVPYWNYNGKWDWFIKNYGNKIKTDKLSNPTNMFCGSKIEEIPFDFNFADLISGSAAQMFNNSSLKSIQSIDFKNTANYIDYGSLFTNCLALTEIGTLKNMYPSGISSMFSGCRNLRYLPAFENLNLSRIQSYGYASANSMFADCYSLREIPEDLIKQLYGIWTSNYSAFYYRTFYYCYALNEIKGLTPTPSSTTVSSNLLANSFEQCMRLKEMTFALQEDGTPYIANWKNQTIDLTKVGYGSTTHILGYNSGITADKEVKDADTYAALKDDPDWFTCDIAYSRYNHTSAVNTINSLPDCSALGGNTIKFTGAFGSLTDGGAINTLTAEEIAVAAAKGWTVSLV